MHGEFGGINFGFTHSTSHLYLPVTQKSEEANYHISQRIEF